MALAFGGVLIVGAVSALFAVERADRPRARPVGGDLPLNRSAAEALSVEAHNSPTVVANPTDSRNLFVVNRVDAPEFGCAASVSFDGGSSWRATALPVVEGAPIGCFAPDAAFGADGLLYVSFTTLASSGPAALWLATSSDGGRTFAPPAAAAGAGTFEVRLATDPNVAGRLYLTWVEASESSRWGFIGGSNPIKVVRSDDGGASWSQAVAASDPRLGRVLAPALAVGSGSRVYLTYLDLGNDRLDYEGAHEGRGGEPYPGPWSLAVARSDDLGRSWAQVVLDREIVPVARLLVLFPPTPSIAADARRGAVYVAFHDARSGSLDVAVWSAPDGTNWGGRRSLNVGVPGDERAQVLPAISVAPNGRVDLAYYDRRRDVQDRQNDVTVQSSHDRARSFGERLRVTSRSFPSDIGYGSERDMPELGSRLGLLSTDRGMLAVWADTRAGTALSGRQDLGRAVVRIDPADESAGILRAGALGTLAAGALLVAFGTLTRRGSRPASARAGARGAAPAQRLGDEDPPSESDEQCGGRDQEGSAGRSGPDQIP